VQERHYTQKATLHTQPSYRNFLIRTRNVSDVKNIFAITGSSRL